MRKGEERRGGKVKEEKKVSGLTSPLVVCDMQHVM